MLALGILKTFGPNRVNWPGRSCMLLHIRCLLQPPVLQREFEIRKWDTELHLQSYNSPWEIDPTLAFRSSCTEDGVTMITPLPLLKFLMKNLVMGLMKNVAKNLAKKGLKNVNEQQPKSPEPWLKTKKPLPDAAA